MKLLIAIGVGVLLNAVPCVLPVLPLKAMSFYEDAGHSRGRSMLNGGLFSLGIIATFGGLALFVISAGRAVGQVHQPSDHRRRAVAVVLLLAAAQAFSAFEFALPKFVTNLEAKTSGPLDYGRDDPRQPSVLLGHAKNFFSGMLIAVLSTPCTIGVFAAVIAVAIAAGSVLGSLILMFVGVGMALPWFALSAFPEATRKFPRTGPWPGVVKQMTGFLLVATAIFFAAPLMPALLPPERALVADLRLRRPRGRLPARPNRPDLAPATTPHDFRVRRQHFNRGRPDTYARPHRLTSRAPFARGMGNSGKSPEPSSSAAIGCHASLDDSAAC